MHAITGNRNYANLLKSLLEKFVKAHQVNLILAGFSHLKPLCNSSSAVQSSQQILNSSQTEKKNDRCASVSFTSSQHVHQPLPKRPSSSKVYISFYIDSHHSGLFSTLAKDDLAEKTLSPFFFAVCYSAVHVFLFRYYLFRFNPDFI